VDETWAHLGKKKPTVPQLCQVNEVLDLLIRIYDKYSLLAGRRKFAKTDEQLFNGWDEPFRVPWTE
jgi:hypothetical protein